MPLQERPRANSLIKGVSSAYSQGSLLMPTHYGIQLALLVLGAYSQIAQALLIRKILVVF